MVIFCSQFSCALTLTDVCTFFYQSWNMQHKLKCLNESLTKYFGIIE